MKLIISFLFFIHYVRNQEEEKPINVKVVPARTNKLTLDDLDEIKFEILHDVIFSKSDEFTIKGFRR